MPETVLAPFLGLHPRRQRVAARLQVREQALVGEQAGHEVGTGLPVANDDVRVLLAELEIQSDGIFHHLILDHEAGEGFRRAGADGRLFRGHSQLRQVSLCFAGVGVVIGFEELVREEELRLGSTCEVRPEYRDELAEPLEIASRLEHRSTP